MNTLILHAVTAYNSKKINKAILKFSNGIFVAGYEYENYFCQCALVFPQFKVKHGKIAQVAIFKLI